MAKTDIDTSATSTAVPSMKFEDLYDWFMLEIEPELTTLIIPYVDDLYADASQDELDARDARYAAAFAKVETMLLDFYRSFGGELTRLRKLCHVTSEKADSQQEQTDLSDITSELSAS